MVKHGSTSIQSCNNETSNVSINWIQISNLLLDVQLLSSRHGQAWFSIHSFLTFGTEEDDFVAIFLQDANSLVDGSAASGSCHHRAIKGVPVNSRNYTHSISLRHLTWGCIIRYYIDIQHGTWQVASFIMLNICWNAVLVVEKKKVIISN